MKKIKILLFSLIGILFLPSLVMAASGTISVISTSTVVVGNKVTVTVKLSSGSAIGSWQMNLNYDKNFLKLTSATSEAGGTKMVNAAQSTGGIKSKSYTFTFKTLKKGSTKVSVDSYLVYDNSMQKMSITTSSKTIKIITQAELEASYSKDNYLKSLSVDGFNLNETFSKDNTSYTLTVPEGTKEIKVNATKNDSKASVSGAGTISLTEGINNVSIVVRAENGSERTYKLTVNVIDENPIIVEIDNVKYTVIKLRENYTCSNLFEESTITINEFNIPTCINKTIDYTLVGLKNEIGEVYEYVYDNGTYTKYNVVVGTTSNIVISKYDGELEGYQKSEEKIDGVNYEVFKFNKNSKQLIVYGINVETGNKGFYIYDTINKTFVTYETEYIDELLKQNELYLYVIIGFGFGLLLAIICMIMLSRKNKKPKKKVIKEVKEDKKEPEVENLDNRIEEVKEQEEKIEADDKKEETKEIEKTKTFELEDKKKKKDK